MPLLKPSAGQIAHIKVIGVGGGGSNAIDTMIKEGGITGVEFISVNTDAQALLHNKTSIKIQIGDALTRGLGSGGNPEIGKKAAEESLEKLKEELQSTDLVFITAGMGGGTGTGAAPIVARVAREAGALTVAVVTKPFLFEGTRRMAVAKAGIAQLKEVVDTLIVVPNQRVIKIVDEKTSMTEALAKIDSVLHQGVRGIAELITQPGLINVDFADVKTIMTAAGTALMGIGIATGEKRAINAVKQAINSPLLDSSIDGAKGLLINISGGPDLTMLEVDEAANLVSQLVDPNADIIFGATISPELRDHVKAILIATKFDERLSVVRLRNDARRDISTDANLRVVDKIDVLEEETTASSKVKSDEKQKAKHTPPDTDYNVDDDPFEVPAFLRKK
jgi:cell division protein FtsZ